MTDCNTLMVELKSIANSLCHYDHFRTLITPLIWHVAKPPRSGQAHMYPQASSGFRLSTKYVLVLSRYSITQMRSVYLSAGTSIR